MTRIKSRGIDSQWTAQKQEEAFDTQSIFLNSIWPFFIRVIGVIRGSDNSFILVLTEEKIPDHAIRCDNWGEHLLSSTALILKSPPEITQALSLAVELVYHILSDEPHSLSRGIFA